MIHMSWHYELSGERLGPVTAEKIKDLYDKGRLNRDTLVWHGPFGSTWKKLGDVYQEFGIDGGPPPLPQKPLSDFWAWLLALSTLTYAIVEAVSKDWQAELSSPVAPIVITFFINCVFVYFDQQTIEKSNRNPENKTLAFWIIIIPIYLLVRAKIVGRGAYLLVVWLITTVILVYAQNPNILNGGVYLGSGIPKCNSGTSISQINNLFEQIPLMKLYSIKLIQSDNYNETSFDGTTRNCLATARASNGQTYNLKYTIKQEGSQFMYYMNIVN